jgi:hypothetical protein
VSDAGRLRKADGWAALLVTASTPIFRPGQQDSGDRLLLTAAVTATAAAIGQRQRSDPPHYARTARLALAFRPA